MLGLLLAPPPDESTETRDQRTMALGISAVLACGLIGGMMWSLGDLATRPYRQEIMQFSKVIVQSSDLEKRAIADVNTLKRYPTTTDGGRAVAGRIRGKLVPEW
ncbi:hypothetical protein ACMX25_34880 [Caballeronia sp. 15715]|jgi:hypothetical protein|uniref:hypothetical protein n=1 Tax=Caballeronia sp. 15715 TaxID=3391030 RepID=UPI0039E5125F